MVKIYTKENCSKCEELKKILTDANVPFETVDTTGNMELLNILREKAEGMGFPMVKFEDGQILAGDVMAILQKINGEPLIITTDVAKPEVGAFDWWGFGGKINYAKINEDTNGSSEFFRRM